VSEALVGGRVFCVVGVSQCCIWGFDRGRGPHHRTGGSTPQARQAQYEADIAAADLAEVPHDAETTARTALAASAAAGNPLSQWQLMTRFGLTRTAERKVRQAVLAEANGHNPG